MAITLICLIFEWKLFDSKWSRIGNCGSNMATSLDRIKTMRNWSLTKHSAKSNQKPTTGIPLNMMNDINLLSKYWKLEFISALLLQHTPLAFQILSFSWTVKVSYLGFWGRPFVNSASLLVFRSISPYVLGSLREKNSRKEWLLASSRNL